MKIKPTEYKSLSNVKCACIGCSDKAYSQVYVCALNGFVAICQSHDRHLNRQALEMLFMYNNFEVDKWMKEYINLPANSPRRKFVSPEKSTLVKLGGKDE